MAYMCWLSPEFGRGVFFTWRVPWWTSGQGGSEFKVISRDVRFSRRKGLEGSCGFAGYVYACMLTS